MFSMFSSCKDSQVAICLLLLFPLAFKLHGACRSFLGNVAAIGLSSGFLCEAPRERLFMSKAPDGRYMFPTFWSYLCKLGSQSTIPSLVGVTQPAFMNCMLETFCKMSTPESGLGGMGPVHEQPWKLAINAVHINTTLLCFLCRWAQWKPDEVFSVLIQVGFPCTQSQWGPWCSTRERCVSLPVSWVLIQNSQ